MTIVYSNGNIFLKMKSCGSFEAQIGMLIWPILVVSDEKDFCLSQFHTKKLYTLSTVRFSQFCRRDSV